MKKIILLAVSVSCIPSVASAATLFLSANPAHIGVGDTVEITLAIDSDQPINVFSGLLHYPSGMEPLAITDGNSIVNLWITRPAADNGTVRFAGATPGGFSGRGGKLFSVLMRATRAGPTQFSVADVQFLRNDGKGTPEPVPTPLITLAIAAQSAGSFSEPSDTAPPEPFAPVLGSNRDIAGGKQYLAFSTVDKGSGMDHFEVAERRWPWTPLVWQQTGSPYVIADQYLTSDVYVKATDRAGNARVAVFHRPYLLRPYEWLVGGMLIALLALWSFMRRLRT